MVIRPGIYFRIILSLILLIGGIYLGHRLLFPPLPLIGVIQWASDIVTFDESLLGVIEGLKEEGYQNGLNICLEVVKARRGRDVTAVAARDFQEKGARLLITLGTIPTLIALEVTRDSKIPLVYCTAGAPDATGLARPAPPAALRFTGASMEVPVAEQLRFLLLARPGLKRLGIFLCNATPQARALGAAAEKVAPELGLVPVMRQVTDDHRETLLTGINDLCCERLDALFIPTDPVLVRPHNLKIICDATFKAMIPVMVANGSSVAHGPLISYHCDFVEMGRQAGRQAARLLQGVPLEEVPPESPKVKRVTINLKTARELNLPLPRQLLGQAYKFYQ